MLRFCQNIFSRKKHTFIWVENLPYFEPCQNDGCSSVCCSSSPAMIDFFKITLIYSLFMLTLWSLIVFVFKLPHQVVHQSEVSLLGTDTPTCPDCPSFIPSILFLSSTSVSPSPADCPLSMLLTLSVPTHCIKLCMVLEAHTLTLLHTHTQEIVSKKKTFWS